jgi:hypothetical protein
MAAVRADQLADDVKAATTVDVEAEDVVRFAAMTV